MKSINFFNCTVKDLKEFAKDLGLKGYSKLKKQELKDMIDAEIDRLADQADKAMDKLNADVEELLAKAEELEADVYDENGNLLDENGNFVFKMRFLPAKEEFVEAPVEMKRFRVEFTDGYFDIVKAENEQQVKDRYKDAKRFAVKDIEEL
jgi:hypothetical protein